MEDINQNQFKALKDLLSDDSPKHLLSNLTDMYIAYNQSDHADCQDDRTSKSGTFLYLTHFLGTLSSIKKT